MSLLFPQTDVILLCYSVDDPMSFHNVLRRWTPELKRHCRGVPKVLLGKFSLLTLSVCHQRIPLPISGFMLLIAGLKSDLKRVGSGGVSGGGSSSHKPRPLPPTVSEKEGEIMQLHIGASAFYEFSVGQQKKLHTIFSKVVRLGMRKKINAYKNSCVIQ